MSDISFAIGEVAAMLGISPHTIRAWERRHLAAQPARTAAGQRRYTSEDVELLRQIKHERHVHGLSMRVATMTAHGLLVPEGDGLGARDASVADEVVDPLRLVTDLLSEVVVLVDGSGRIQHANTAFVRFSDLLLGQVRGLPLADLVDPFDRAKAVQVYQGPLRPRRGWEFGLRTKRRRGLFSFDCWPVPASDGPVLLLVGRRLDQQRPVVEAAPVAVPAGRVAEPAPCALPPQVRALLADVADPARIHELLRSWLDVTPLGVVLVRTDESLTAEFGNDVFAGLLPAERLPFEGRPWGELAGSDGEGRLLAAAAREVAGSGRCRTVPGFRPCRGEQSSPPVWDLDLCPVTQAGGAVTHVLMAIRDVSPEVRAAQRLEPLAIGASDLRRASDAGQVLAAAVRHAGSLLPNAGSLVALVRDGEPEGIDVIAADGVWARTDQAGEPDLRLTLIRDVARTGTTIEIERAGVLDSVESLRIVPLLAAPALRRRTAVLGTLALSRLDSGPFSAVDRLLMDEFAGRVGAALRLAQHLGPTGRPLPPAD